MTRVAIFGDPSHGLGSLRRAGCARIMGALGLAEKRRLPAEWYAVSAGAKISMESGTENMDWISAVLRRIITFTQAGCELNILVCGVTVGAQPYWNAEATMLMHPQDLDDRRFVDGPHQQARAGLLGRRIGRDNEGIGGFEANHGPRKRSQYFARDVPEACDILLRHYDHTYIVPGEPFRGAQDVDPVDRDQGLASRPALRDGGWIFQQKIPRSQNRSTSEGHAGHGHQRPRPLERWGSMKRRRDFGRGTPTSAVIPCASLGIESQPVPRRGIIPADGPAAWTSGTLFPRSSRGAPRRQQRERQSSSGGVLANLSGFDGSPGRCAISSSEYGAEIGRAVVNFRGPIVHGRPRVITAVRSSSSRRSSMITWRRRSKGRTLGDRWRPAAAVVFAGQVAKRTGWDPRVLAPKPNSSRPSVVNAWCYVIVSTSSRRLFMPRSCMDRRRVPTRSTALSARKVAWSMRSSRYPPGLTLSKPSSVVSDWLATVTILSHVPRV